LVTENEPRGKIIVLVATPHPHGLVRNPIRSVVRTNRHGCRLAGDQRNRH
jgi:hypothetical protein